LHGRAELKTLLEFSDNDKGQGSYSEYLIENDMVDPITVYMMLFWMNVYGKQ
jgi:hypothetical protein